MSKTGWVRGFVVLAVSAAPLVAGANVSLRNGNFFVGYTDIVYPGGFEPKVERVYNSKSAFQGMFGWGWGNEYETQLNVAADGSVVVHEFGGGADNRFSPQAFNPRELDAAVATISEAARQGGSLGSAEQINGYRQRLRSDANFRTEEWERLRRAGKVQARQLPVNTRLFSNRFSFQYLTRIQGGYQRNFESGRIERFDDAGHLARVSDKNGNFIDFTYGKDGRIQKLVDNFNRKIFLTFNTQGRLEKIQGEGGKEGVYRYNEQGELVYSRDVDGNVYSYKYSPDKRHNLVEIAYSDRTTLQVAYYGRDRFENVRSVKDRDGSVSDYAYDLGSADKSRLAVAVNVKGADGAPVSKSRYEYFVKRKADGEEWTYKLISELDGDRTETVYNECCGLPLLIKRDGEETAFEYNARGSVTKKITPTEITQLVYDPQVGKVAKVTRFSKANSKQVSWSEFKYDDKGNLTFAKNSEGQGVKLVYDTVGRIKSLLDQNRRRIDFKYNENSKPVEISDPQLGSILVTYSNSGEIKKVDSPAGRKIAMQVTTAFQNLLDIIRPAGVSLSF